MRKIKAYAVQDAHSPFAPFTVERRDVGPHDVAINIAYCGICHSDVHAAHDDWGNTRFPLVPGHEIVGTVEAVGSDVKRWQVGQTVGVGCMVNSCRHCAACMAHEEQYCENGWTATYNSYDKYGDRTLTRGGYSTYIVVNEHFVLRIPDGMPPERTAPLLCAGITTYHPLRLHGVGPGKTVGVVGLGGLGHVAVKLAKAMGAHVTMVSHSPGKEADAKRLGADDFLLTRDPEVFKHNAKRFDLLLDTVAVPHNLDSYMNMLKRHGVLAMVGQSTIPELHTQSLIMQGRQLSGSLIGGIQETQEMLEFCAARKVYADIELVTMEELDTAYERMVKSDVRYRFVIDVGKLVSQ